MRTGGSLAETPRVTRDGRVPPGSEADQFRGVRSDARDLADRLGSRRGLPPPGMLVPGCQDNAWWAAKLSAESGGVWRPRLN